MEKILLILVIFSTAAKAENHSAIDWLSRPESGITVTILDEPTAVLDEQINDISGLESCIFDAAMSHELQQNDDDLLKASKAITIKEYLGWVKIYELIEADMIYDHNYFINGEGFYLDKKTFMPKEKNITRAEDAFTVLKRRYAHYLSLMLDNINMGYEFSFDTDRTKPISKSIYACFLNEMQLDNPIYRIEQIDENGDMRPQWHWDWRWE
jgi:hypothetical protein